MLAMSRAELNMLINGKARAFSRMYPNACPHKVSEELILSTTPDVVAGNRGNKPGNVVPLAVARVISVRPATVRDRRANDAMAQADGFTNADAWYGEFVKRYGAVNGLVYQVQIEVTKDLREPSRTVAS